MHNSMRCAHQDGTQIYNDMRCHRMYKIGVCLPIKFDPNRTTTIRSAQKNMFRIVCLRDLPFHTCQV